MACSLEEIKEGSKKIFDNIDLSSVTKKTFDADGKMYFDWTKSSKYKTEAQAREARKNIKKNILPIIEETFLKIFGENFKTGFITESIGHNRLILKYQFPKRLEEAYERKIANESSIDQNAKEITLINSREVDNMLENLSEVLLNKTEKMIGLTGDLFYIDLLKTNDDRYFIFKEAQDIEEITKEEYHKLNYENEGVEKSEKESKRYIKNYLEIYDFERLENPVLKYFFTDKQISLARTSILKQKNNQLLKTKEEASSNVLESLIEKFFKDKNNTKEELLENNIISQELINLHKNRGQDTFDDTERKIELLKKSFNNNVEVIVDGGLDTSGRLLASTHPLTKKYGKPIILINPNKLFSDTVIHEFGHLYIDLLGADNSVVKQAINMLKGTDLYYQIESQYPELGIEDLEKEVLATAIGLKGDQIFKRDLVKLSNWQRIKNFILNALSKIFSMSENAIERLAKDMLENNLKLTGSELFNSIIDQNSRFQIDIDSKDKQGDILKLFKELNKTYSKSEIDGNNVYSDAEGNVLSSSVTKNIEKYKFQYSNIQDKGYINIKFDKTLFNKENILLELQAPKMSRALVKALNDLIYERIGDGYYIKNSEDKTWLDSYLRELGKQSKFVRKDELDDLWKDLIKDKKTFLGAVVDNFEEIMNKAEEYQDLFNRAPLAGSYIHNAIENYILEGETFPSNLIDEEQLLFSTIKDIIDSGHSKGSKFVTEQILVSENRNLPGTADLIEITKEGEVIIYDYKTLQKLKNKDETTSFDKLIFKKGYAHQLASYGAILNQYGIVLNEDPYKVILIEIDYSSYYEEQDDIIVKDVLVKSLTDKDTLPQLNNVKSKIFKEFASSVKLNEINIKPELKNLDELVNKIYDYITNYRHKTKTLSSTLDTSFMKKIHEDLLSNKEINDDVNTYVSTNNQLIIKSYIENIHDSLSVLEAQKTNIGEQLTPEYLQSLDFLLKSTEGVKNIKTMLLENTEVEFENPAELIELIDNTLDVINYSEGFYKDKLKQLAIGTLVENSNYMEGLYLEKYKLKARISENRKSKDDIEKYALDQVRLNKDEIKVKELNYWTSQYETGIVDLRAAEYWIADPGMTKSMFVQVVKNVMDKSDLAKRNKMLDILPEINNWYEKLSFETKGDPKKVWDKFIERKTVINKETNKKETRLAGRIISEFDSKYRQTYLKYEVQIKENERVIRKLQLKSSKNEKEIKLIEELKDLNKALRTERYETLKEKENDKDFIKLFENKDFTKLSEEEKEAARFIHRNLTEADDRVQGDNSKKLVKTLSDDSKIYYLPKKRMDNLEALYDKDKAISDYKSKIKDLLRPPSDEDEFNITQDEFNLSVNYNSNTLDSSGNEVFEVPVYYRQELEDDSLQSYDIPTLLAINHDTTVNYQESKFIEADLFAIKESLSSKNNNNIHKSDSLVNKKIQDKIGNIFQKSDQNLVYQAVKSSIDNRLYKRAYKGVYSKNNYRFIKGAEVMSKYASTLVLAGNFMSALATFSQGSIYRAIEANVGEHMNKEDWAQGTKKAWRDVNALLKDTQSFVPNSKTNLLIKKFGLETMNHVLTNKFVQNNFASKNLDSDTLYGVTSIAEKMVTSNLMYSLLNNVKALNEKGEFINKDGKKVSKKEAMTLDEAYEVVEGKLVLNKHVSFTTFNVSQKFADGANKDNTVAAVEVSNYIKGVYADLYGQYNQDMKSVLQRTIIGKLGMSLRGWLPRGMHKRWRGITDVISSDFMDFEQIRDERNADKRFYSQDQKRFQEGHYVTSIRFVRSLFKEMKQNQLTLNASRNKIKNLMTDHEIANLKRTQYELAMMGLMFALSMFLRAIALSSGDDKDKEKLYFIAYLAHRIKSELATFIYPPSFFEILKNPAASISVIERVFDFTNQLLWFSYQKDENSFSLNYDDEYEKGSKKGENKAIIKALNLIPGRVKFNQLMSILGTESLNTMEDSFEYVIKN